ncbi:EMAL3 protein, partial [Polypterus senegalus]|nr:EMAL3 protein [Polypterus senegalus]
MDGLGNSLDDVSAGSSPEFLDRLSVMEVRLQTQEEEITLLKSALTDTLRRIRIYDEQIPLIKQHIIAVNPAAAAVLNHPCFTDANTCLRKVPISCGLDCLHRSSCPSYVGVPAEQDGFIERNSLSNKKEKSHQIYRLDVGTQTDESLVDYLQHSTFSFHPATENDDMDLKCRTSSTKISFAHTRAVQSLSLEDALIPESPLLKENVKNINCLPEPTLENPPMTSWTNMVEEQPVRPTYVSGLLNDQQQLDLLPKQDKDAVIREYDESHLPPVEEGKETNHKQLTLKANLEDDVPGKVKEPNQFPPSPSQLRKNQNPTSKSGHMSPVSTVTENEKKPLIRRNSSSDKLVKENLDKNKQKLAKKTVSSINLLTRSSSLENRKDLVSNSSSFVSRRLNQDIPIKMFIRGRPITMYCPSNIQNYENLRVEQPTEKLDLEWAYGYRGRDCRSNLYLLPSGEVVYFIACVVVLYHIDDQTQRHYLKHTDCVRCLAVHPDKVRVATGQTAGVDKDGKPLQPFVHIWSSSTLLTLQQIGLGCFERGVGSISFSYADFGSLLCVVDDSNEHMLSVWDWNKGIKLTEIKSTNEAVFAVEFNPADSNNIISCGKSHVYFWTWNAGTLTKKQGIFGKYKKPKFIQCFVFNENGDVLTGDSEGNILTWGKTAADTKTLGKGAKETYQIVRQTKAHEGSIFTLCLLKSGALLSGGGKDRKIMWWSKDLTLDREDEIPEQFGAVRTIAEVKEGELLIGTTKNAILRGKFSDGFTPIVQGHTGELWGLATHPFKNMFLSCAHDKQVCLWNGVDHSLEWSSTLEETGLCADFHPNGNVVAVGLNTGRWVVLDIETREVVSDFTNGNEQLSVVRYSPDGVYLAVGSHDNFIYIYIVTEAGRRYTRFGKCTGHSSFITHLDWSKDSKFIMSNSGDYEILYWDVAGGCKLIRNRFESKDREWASYTCVLGFHVIGVWLEGSDGTDINALCRSHNERVVAVADDFCKVHLFQYPCPVPKAPSHRYDGHGSHVTNVRFTYSDSHLISMGGKDMSILQWRLVGGSLDRSSSVSCTSIGSSETGGCG